MAMRTAMLVEMQTQTTTPLIQQHTGTSSSNDDAFDAVTKVLVSKDDENVYFSSDTEVDDSDEDFDPDEDSGDEVFTKRHRRATGRRTTHQE